jgi:inositol-polyphosphate multikinase
LFFLALRIFLNADIGLDRQLIMEFLSVLWNVQAWARKQTKFRLYSSSLLLIYDARRLRHNSKYHTKNVSPPSGQLNGICKDIPSPLNGNTPPPIAVQDAEIEPTHHYYQIQRNHSVTNNYDKDYKEMRQQYELMLDSMLLDSVHKKEWATIKMIDFAHAFVNNDVEAAEADEVTLDDNYLFGVENLVKLFEEFLRECE